MNLGPEILVLAISDTLSSPRAAPLVIAAVVAAGEARGPCSWRFVVRRFEPHLDGPRRALKRIETRSLSWENAIEAQVYLDGGIQATTAHRPGGYPWSRTSTWGNDRSAGFVGLGKWCGYLRTRVG
ncbi:hypothetical protein GCM10009687_06530 [Asanoa iriomotensis]|uniref:Uncharacterized protein n=1 Tax=Asanoa iriomotensis TaxID=234613 RepID=A0ABQ4C1Q1_9ACTN|nr:hypothetical protein Air01nite_27990 [Asanoa iriomotensis]